MQEQIIKLVLTPYDVKPLSDWTILHLRVYVCDFVECTRTPAYLVHFEKLGPPWAHFFSVMLRVPFDQVISTNQRPQGNKVRNGYKATPNDQWDITSMAKNVMGSATDQSKHISRLQLHQKVNRMIVNEI